jgi:hypothetical protein
MNWKLFRLFFSYLYHLDKDAKLIDDIYDYDRERREKHQAIFAYFGKDRIKNRDGIYHRDKHGEFIDGVISNVMCDERKLPLHQKLLEYLQKTKIPKVKGKSKDIITP